MAFRSMGLKLKGYWYAELFAFSSREGLEALDCFMPTSRAILFRKLTTWNMSAHSITKEDKLGWHTGLANQRLPPHSNQLRWPPREVEHMTIYGFSLISTYGTASSTAI